jgi:hypothetical protein
VSREFVLNEEFDTPLLGWALDIAGGQAKVNNSLLHLEEKPGGDTMFPLLWRNNAFPSTGDFAFEIKFQFSHISAYGVTIGLGSEQYDGTRYLEGEPSIQGIEDILGIHHFSGEFRITLRQQVVWQGLAGDEQPHVVRLEREGQKYILFVDGFEIARFASNLRPASLYLGNPAIERFQGPWTRLDIGSIKVTRCATWGHITGYLPLLTK